MGESKGGRYRAPKRISDTVCCDFKLSAGHLYIVINAVFRIEIDDDLIADDQEIRLQSAQVFLQLFISVNLQSQNPVTAVAQGLGHKHGAFGKVINDHDLLVHGHVLRVSTNVTVICKHGAIDLIRPGSVENCIYIN